MCEGSFAVECVKETLSRWKIDNLFDSVQSCLKMFVNNDLTFRELKFFILRSEVLEQKNGTYELFTLQNEWQYL